MRRIEVFVILFLFGLVSCKEKGITENPTVVAKKVKTTSIFDVEESDTILTEVRHYNPNGNLQFSKHLYPDNSQVLTYYQYSEQKNNLIKEIASYDPKTDMEIDETSQFGKGLIYLIQFNEHGDTLAFEDDCKEWYFEYTYSPNFDVLEKRKTVKRKCASPNFFNGAPPDTSLLINYVYTYDSSTYRLKKVVCKELGLDDNYTYQYLKNKTIEKIFVNSELVHRFTSNMKGQVIQEDRNINRFLGNVSTTNTLDEDGRIIRQCSIEQSSGSTIPFCIRIEYDDFENIKRKVYMRQSTLNSKAHIEKQELFQYTFF